MNNPKDGPLDALLQEWKIEVPLPPRFQELVWKRIEGSGTGSVSTFSLLASWFANLVSRPAFSVSCALMLLVVGATAGWARARQESARMSGELSARYVQAVDPYQANP